MNTGDLATTAPWTGPDRAALARFLRERGLGGGDASGADLEIRRIGDGHSNLTYAVTTGNSTVVVRRPPPPPAPPGAHDVLREASVLAALRDSPVPVPAVLATARAGEVIDVPCYVMSFADGPVVTTATPAPLGQPASRRQFGEALIDTLARLHAVDWRAAGLAGLGRPDGFNPRHLRRIGQLVADSGGRLPPRFATAGAWLSAHVPPESGAAIVHGDYRLGNVVLAPAPPGRIAAVLDWELSSLGDPLTDLAMFLFYWESVAHVAPTLVRSITGLPGFPSGAELAQRWAGRTGLGLDDLDWYKAFAHFKFAVITQGIKARVHAGAMGGQDFGDLTSVVADTAQAGLTLIRA